MPRPCKTTLRNSSSVAGAPLGKGLLSEQAVQAGRIFDQMEVRCVMTCRAELLIHLLASEAGLVGLDGLATASLTA